MSFTISLNGDDWAFKDFYGEDWNWRKSVMPNTRDRRWWRTSGSVPGSVQDDLWRLGEIPNPYYERNSLLCEWVPERTWLYKKTFFIAENLKDQRIHLHFKGVDYSARFFLNGESLGEACGMFKPVVFEVTGKLHYGADNLVAVVIEPAPQEQPQVGYTNRVKTTKSRMNYWWDFCPRMIHLGIWDDVYLEVTGPVRVENVFVRPQLSIEAQHADITTLVRLDAAEAAAVEVETTINFAGTMIARQINTYNLPAGQTEISSMVQIDQPRLWWPNGYGEQAIYQAEFEVKTNHRETAYQSVQFGIRLITLEKNEAADPDSMPYTFVVNGQRMYAKGWNWVPIDVLYGVPRPEKMERLLKLAQNAHVNLLRVWGGGLIEKDAFYDLCDRLGILVWQEFIQSSSGIDNSLPTSSEYIQMWVETAEQAVPARRNHPSLALWCGGNELQSGHENPLDDSDPTLAALKAVVKRLDPDRLWLPTSPSGGVFSNSLENITSDTTALQDVHGPWEYQGVTKQCQLYNQGCCLFHSEFGVEGITNLKTLDSVIAKEHQWPVTLDNTYWFHLGAWWVKRPVWDQAFGELADVENLVRATQFMQAEGLRYALEADRRRKYHNSGTLPWQFNEPYPMAACTSAVDYYAQPKPAYYAVARAYALLNLTARFPTQAWEGFEQFEAEIWVNNSSRGDAFEATLQMQIINAQGNVILKNSQTIQVEADCARQVAAIRFPMEGIEADVFFLDLSLSGPGGILTANRYTFSRQADLAALLRLPLTDLKVQQAVIDDSVSLQLTNTGETVAMNIWLEDGRTLDASGYVYFDDNYFCLFPGETRKIFVNWQGLENVQGHPPLLKIGGWNTSVCWAGQEEK